MIAKVGIVTMSMDKWEIGQISNEIKKWGFDTEFINDKNSIIDYRKVAERRGRYAAVLGRVERPILYEGLTILRSLEIGGERVFNNAEAIHNGQNKAYCSLFLSWAGIPHPRTIFGFASETIFNELDNMNFPVVFKPWIGGRGIGIVRADNPGIARDFIEIMEHNHQPFYIQEFVCDSKIDKFRDIRAFVVGNDVIGAFYREASVDNWKTNLSYGGIPKKYKLDPAVKEMSLQAVKAIGADIAGVDVIESDEGYQVLEVNVCPLFRGFHDITGINPAKSIAELIINPDVIPCAAGI